MNIKKCYCEEYKERLENAKKEFLEMREENRTLKRALEMACSHYGAKQDIDCFYYEAKFTVEPVEQKIHDFETKEEKLCLNY